MHIFWALEYPMTYIKAIFFIHHFIRIHIQIDHFVQLIAHFLSDSWLIDDYRIINMILRLHMSIQQRFSHETHAAYQTFVRLFIAVHESMCIPIITAVKCFAAHFTSEWLHARMNANMLLIMFGVDKCWAADIASIWPFAGMAGAYVIF